MGTGTAIKGIMRLIKNTMKKTTQNLFLSSFFAFFAD